MKKFNVDAEKVLSEISGISKTEIRKISCEVIENNKKLNSCSYHNFISKMTPSPVRRGAECVCTNCGGTVDNIKKYWYELGLRHQIGAEGKWKLKKIL